MVIFRHTFFDTFAWPGYGAFFFGGGVPFFPFTHLSNTWQGVGLFFVDSGFVLYLPFVLGKRRIERFADVRDVWVRRAYRLLPLYYAMLLVYYAFDLAMLHRMRAPLAELPYYATFAFTFTNDLWMPRPNGILWSIGVEVCFSLAMPLFVLLIRRVGMLRFLAAAIAIGTLTRYLAYADGWGVQKNHNLNTLADSLLGRIDAFALGMAAATLFARRYEGLRPSVAVAASFLLFTASAWLWDTHIALARPSLVAPLIGNALASFAFFALLLGALRAEGILARVLTFAPLRAAGVGCYSLYLVHMPVLWIWHGRPHGLEIVAAFALMAVLSALTYRFIEKPGMELGRRRVDRAR